MSKYKKTKDKKIPLAPLSTALLSSQALASFIPDSGVGLDYKVQKGDTLGDIAQQEAYKSQILSYSQTLALILKLNQKENLLDYNLLKIGQIIKIPDKKTEMAYWKYYQKRYPSYWNPKAWKAQDRNTQKPYNYKVRRGDSLSKIAKRFFPELPLLGPGNGALLLQKKNPSIQNMAKIFVGQRLIIPKKEEALAFQKEYAHLLQKNKKALSQEKKREQKEAPKKAVSPPASPSLETKKKTAVPSPKVRPKSQKERLKKKAVESAVKPLKPNPLPESLNPSSSGVKSVLPSQTKKKKMKAPSQLKKVRKGYRYRELNSTVELEGLDDIIFDGSSSIKKGQFEIPSIKTECCKKIQMECYATLHKKLLQSTDRKSTIVCLKNLLDFSRECGHETTAHYHLKLISLFVNSNQEEMFLRSLKNYLNINC